MIQRLFYILLIVGLSADAWATRYWVDPSGSDATACGSTASDADPGVYRATPQGGEACLAAGDRLTVKAGTYTGSTARFRDFPSGASASAPTILEGDPSSDPWCAILQTCPTILKPTVSGSSTLPTDKSNFIIRNFDIDHTTASNLSYPIRIAGTTCTNVVLQNLELHATLTVSGGASGIITDASCNNITVDKVNIHDNGRSTTAVHHGIYQQGDDFTLTNSWIHGNSSIGIQCYTATALSDGRADRCNLHHNIIEGNPTMAIAAESYDGEIHHNLLLGGGTCITLGYSGSLRTKIYNNVCYRSGSDAGTAMNIGAFSPASDSEIKNNIIAGYTNAVSVDAASTGVTQSHNACGAAKSCGSTGKVSISAITDLTVSTTDLTLKSGSAAINAGTDVGFASCGSAPDIGAFEVPVVTAASIFGNLLDVTVCTASPPIQPLGTWTPACTGTGCGTPVTSNVSLLSGSGGVARVEVGGITGSNCAASQTWTISASGSNTDSANIGGTSNQPLHTVTNFSVDSSLCDGTGGGGFPSGAVILHEFDGDCDDDSGNADHCTTSGSPTFVTAKFGQGLQTTAGATQYAATTWGSGVNPTTQSFTICDGVWITPGTESTVDIVPFGAPVGSSQRLYVRGFSGTWTVLAQGSTNSASDRPIVSGWNRVCVIANATDDTVKIANNGIIATTGGGVKSVTSYTLAGPVEVGHLPGNVSATAIHDQFIIWESVIDVADDFAAWDAATAASTATQAGHQWQGVFQLSGAAENRGSANAQRTVNKGGSAALMVQINNETGGAITLQPRFRYNINGGAFTNVVPDTPTADGISYWGASAPSGLNNGAADGPISGALSHTDGITLTSSAAVPTLDRADNTSYTLRGLFLIDATIGDVVCFKIYDQGGSPLDSYTPADGACLTVVGPTATGGY